jgi:hypothetical protein
VRAFVNASQSDQSRTETSHISEGASAFPFGRIRFDLIAVADVSQTKLRSAGSSVLLKIVELHRRTLSSTGRPFPNSTLSLPAEVLRFRVLKPNAESCVNDAASLLL